DLCPPVTANRLGTATAGSVGQAMVEPLTQVALTPGEDSWPGDIEPLGDLGVGRAFGGQQQNLGPLDHHGRSSGRARPAPQPGQVIRTYGQGSGRQRHARMLPAALTSCQIILETGHSASWMNLVGIF